MPIITLVKDLKEKVFTYKEGTKRNVSWSYYRELEAKGYCNKHKMDKVKKVKNENKEHKVDTKIEK